MPRAKRGFKARRRRNKILKLAKGYRGARSKIFSVAKRQVEKALQGAFAGRKMRKRDFRSLWIMRINAAARTHGLSYSRFINGLDRAAIEVDRKVMAEMAVNDPAGFAYLAEQAKLALQA